MVIMILIRHWLKVLILKLRITWMNAYSRKSLEERLLDMKACPNEKKIAKKSDLKKMKKEILREDRKEDDKKYAKKSSKSKKS